jgi:hypothetical protein
MRRVLKERVMGLLERREVPTLTLLHEQIEAQYPGFAWKTLSKAINGRTSPTLGTLDAIASTLNTTVAYLIGEVDDPSPELGVGDPLPEVRAWSDRLRALPPDQRAKFVQGLELMLAAFEAGNSSPQ